MEAVNKDEEPAEDKAADETPATSRSVTPRRGLRERGASRPRSGVSPSLLDVNGAVSSSGRVLRDRSTRTVPAWLKDTKSDDEEEEEEPSPDTGATKRRKVPNSRRKKQPDCGAEAAGGVAGDSLQGTEYVFFRHRHFVYNEPV